MIYPSNALHILRAVPVRWISTGVRDRAVSAARSWMSSYKTDWRSEHQKWRI